MGAGGVLGETGAAVGRPWAQPAAGAPRTLIFQNREHHRTPRRKEEGTSTWHPKSVRAGVGEERRVPQNCPFTGRGTARLQGGPGFAQSQLKAGPADPRYLGASLHKCHRRAQWPPVSLLPAIIKELTVCRGDSGRTIQALPSELPLVGKHTFHEQTQVNPLSQVREREAGRGS